MARYQYVGDDTRVYPEVPITVSPGDVVEFDTAPTDGRWAELVKAADKPADKPAAKKTTAAAGTKPDAAPADTSTGAADASGSDTTTSSAKGA